MFHLVNGAVIYTNWRDEALKERTNNLIKAIEANKKFVSMECLFTDFSYAVYTPDGKTNIIVRDESTAWMTKHLRAYGGSGIHNGYEICRYLLNITFSGKGYVDKPANPNSIILNNNVLNLSTASMEKPSELQEKPNISEDGVFIKDKSNLNSTIEEKLNMTEEFLKEQNNELKETVKSLEAKLAEVNDKFAKVNVDQYEKTAADLESKLELANKASDGKVGEIAQLTEDGEKLQAKYDEIEKTNKDLNIELDKVKTAEVKANRISTLVDGGIDKEIAEKKVDTFGSLSDEQFGDLSNELIAAHKIQNPQGSWQ